MVKQCFLEDQFAANIDNVAPNVRQVALSVDKTTTTVNSLSVLVHDEQRLTTGVHLDVTQDPVNVEACEWEDLGEFAAVLELRFKEDDFALSRADMTIVCHNVASPVDHEAGLVDVYFVTVLIASKQELDITITVPIEHAHDLLQLKCFPVVVEQLGQKTSKLAELRLIKPLDTMLIDNASIFVNKEALQRDGSAELVNNSTATMCLLEAKLVLNIIVEEGT